MKIKTSNQVNKLLIACFLLFNLFISHFKVIGQLNYSPENSLHTYKTNTNEAVKKNQPINLGYNSSLTQIISVSPILSSDSVYIKINVALKRYFLQIRDINEQLIMEITSEKSQFQLNISQFREGLYYIHLTNLIMVPEKFIKY
jgi:hypothetical protein